MRVKVTAKKNDDGLWDNKLVITRWRGSGWSLEDIDDLVDDNGGVLVKEKPLTFKIYDCERSYESSVEVDTILMNLKNYSLDEIEVH